MNRKLRIPKYHISHPITYMIVCLWIASLLAGILLSAKPLLGIYGMVKLCEFISFAWITFRLLHERQLFIKVLYAYSSGLLIQSVLAIAQFYSQGSLGGVLYYLGERAFTTQTPGIANASLNGTLLLRPYGTLPHPNVLAGYILIGLIVLASYLPLFATLRQKVFAYATILLGIIALLLSMSRTAVLLGLLLLLFVFYQAAKSRFHVKQKSSLRKHTLWQPLFFSKNTFHYGVVAGMIIGLFGLVVIPIAPRFLIFDILSDAVKQREALAIAAVKMFLRYPVLGVGLHQFLVQLPYFAQLHFGIVPLQPVHNIYLLVAAETGSIGVLCFLLFLAGVYKRISSNKNRVAHARMLFITVLSLGMTDHYFLTLQQGEMLFAFVIGLIMVSGNGAFVFKREKNNRKQTFSRREA